LDEATGETLDRIRQRDGTRYFTETARALLKQIAVSIDVCAGPKALRRAIDELEDYSEWNKDYTRSGRLRTRGESYRSMGTRESRP
jgi:hypothetical protein